jgi:hypothetical protein
MVYGRCLLLISGGDMEGQELESRLGKLKLALQEVRKRHKELTEEMDRLGKQELYILGQIKEREFDLPQNPTLPVYKTKEDLEKALANRGKDILGRDAGETAEFRQGLMEKEGSGTVDYIDKTQKSE